MAEQKTPGDAADNAKTDATNTAEEQKEGTKKDADDSKQKAMTDAAGAANQIIAGGNVKDVAKDLAMKQMDAVKEKAKQREEEAKQAAIQMALKNADIAKQMAIGAAMGEAQNLLGDNKMPGMDSPSTDGLGQKGPDAKANDLNNEKKKQNDINPSES